MKRNYYSAVILPNPSIQPDFHTPDILLFHADISAVQSNKKHKVNNSCGMTIFPCDKSASNSKQGSSSSHLGALMNAFNNLNNRQSQKQSSSSRNSRIHHHQPQQQPSRSFKSSSLSFKQSKQQRANHRDGVEEVSATQSKMDDGLSEFDLEKWQSGSASNMTKDRRGRDVVSHPSAGRDSSTSLGTMSTTSSSASLEYNLHNAIVSANNRNQTHVHSRSSNATRSASSSQQQHHRQKHHDAQAWRTAVCPQTQKTYYWNIYTRESRWKKPIELATPEERNAIQTREKAQKEFFKQMEANILNKIQENCRKVATESNTQDDAEDHDGIAHTAFAAAGVPPVFNRSGCLISSADSHSSSDLSLNSLETRSIVGNSPGGGSFSSLEADERDDKVPPLVKQSKLERIKSGSKKAIIDKPTLIRTISAMEYDFAALFSNGAVYAGTAVGGASSIIPALNSPQSPPFSDILSSLHLTHEAGGVGCVLANNEFKSSHYVSPGSSMDISSPSSPLTPATPVGNELIIPNDHSMEDASADSPISAKTSPCVRPLNASPRSDMTKPNLAKRNTCGTIYLSTTLSAPDKDALIKCVCGVFRAHLLQSSADAEFQVYQTAPSSPTKRSSGEIFNDDPKYHVKTPIIPTLDDITAFYRDVFLRSQMEVDCIIISLIYIERLIKKTDGEVRPNVRNWRSVLFSCMVLSSKVWDDLSMWNCDFSKIGPSGVTFSLQRTNQLEVALLSHLEYKVKVNASEYAKYYFLLRSMLCRSGLASDTLSSLSPLDVKGAKTLEKGAVISKTLPDLPVVISRSKSFNESEKNGSDADLLSSQKSPTSKRVSLEHIVRM
eukprot:CAMPEP_0171332070 /NCGR_PEP_ID=MMETSP0878-20121228/3144_1 /TAXON_ID=67004 /ORGANISM="Thalassiosira weissflogii, Strain CCMP1336" /LENGTH=835 /DNA_ID=CAMNT_0011832767 /DNA_START=362 /DNA_END=2869 /DNA_ORIENTATION=-